MVSLYMALRSVARRGFGLLLIVGPAAILFAMVTFLFATETTVRQLLAPGLAQRAFRIGSVEGTAKFDDQCFTPADVSQLAATPGATMAPGFFHACFADPSDPSELSCDVVNRTYIEIWSMDMYVPPAELDRWDAQRDGVIISRKAALRHGWKVGDHIGLQFNTETKKKGMVMDLVITYIADTYIDPTTVYMHIPYYEHRFAGVDVSKFWVVWVLVDKPEHRQAIMDEMDHKLLRPHIIWTMELTRNAILTGSKVLRECFRFAGIFSFLLVTCLAVALLIISVEQRTTEFAALRAIGFRRGIIARSVLFEGVLLLLPAAILGAFLIWIPLQSHPVRFDSIFTVKVTLTDVLEAVACGAIVGFFGALVPAWRAYRIDVLASLR